MPRDWMRDTRGRDERRGREDWRGPGPGRGEREPPPHERDFGQADFSNDYGYDPDQRAGYRAADDPPVSGDDYGQADYSTDYGYDPERGRGYRRFSEDDRDPAAHSEADRIYGRRMDQGDYRHGQPPRYGRDPRDVGERSRSWSERAGAFFSGRDEGRPAPRRNGPSDRVLWTVIVERLEAERGLDLRDIEVLVNDAEVTLNGTVRRKEDKRRIEDVADVRGVRHVQNNLRVRDTGRRWF